MSDGELLDAREAMSLLGVNETDLQTMVARGSLRAFRSAGTMKFRRDDVLGIKTEKKSDAAIIMPANAPKTRQGSGILPTVSPAKSPRGSSRNLPAIKTATIAAAAGAAAGAAAARATHKSGMHDNSTSSDQIILEEFELSPNESDPAANTGQVTASNTAINGGVTVVDGNLETGNQTVVEQGIDIDTASATASAIAPAERTTTGSGRMKVPSSRLNDPTINAPAMSRVRAAVSATSTTSGSRCSQAVATARSSHPIMTLVLVLTAGIYLYTATILGVQIFKGNYDAETHQRVIPPFLANAPFVNYTTTYTALPGTPDDTEGDYKRPKDEPPGGTR